MDVRVLGPLRVLVDDAELSLGGRKNRILLAMLVINRRRVVSAEALADAVWNGDPPPTYATSLQGSVSVLRKTFRDAGVDSTQCLRTVAPGYLLELAETDCDVGRFERARARAAVVDKPAEAAHEYRAALAQWGGEVLADLRGEGFVETFAAALDEERWQTLTARIASDIAAGNASATIGELVKLTSEHSLREPLWEQLISALYLVGRQSDALAACRRVRQILADELGVDPSPQLVRLEQRILRQEPLDVPQQNTHRASGSTKTEIDAADSVRVGRLVLSDGRLVEVSPRLRIGRAADNDIAIEDPKVSRYHARIAWGSDGLVVRDLESTNGVYVDDERIASEAVLRHGVRIRIGSTLMTFEEF